MPDNHEKRCQVGLCYYASNACPIAFKTEETAAVIGDLEQARKALETTLFDEGKSKEYIDDFLSHYDRNLKNIEDWHAANAQLVRFRDLREGKLIPGENVTLRADDDGKPVFHLTPEAFRRLLNNA